jgi:hypothetical protein
MKNILALSSILVLGLALIVASALGHKASAADKSRMTQRIVTNQQHDVRTAVVKPKVTKLRGKWCCCSGPNGPECVWVDDDFPCLPCGR